MSSAGPVGFVLVDKEGGWTSHDVVAKIRGALGVRKVGHAGTLDPMATGLLVVALGRATRLLRFVQGAPKRYVATALLGVATDTLDADGAVVWREPLPVTVEDVTGAFARFVGTVVQVPPMVSARRVEGRRLYELAREGTTVAREARPVTIYRLALVDFAPGDYPEVTFEVECSTGTYVRTLADDMARALGGRAHLVALRRTAIGALDVSRASTVAEIEAQHAAGSLGSVLLTPAQALTELPAVEVPSDLVHAVTHGMPIAGSRLGSGEAGYLKLVDAEGALLAVYRGGEGRAMPEVVMV